MKNQHTLAESSPLAELLHLNLDDTLGAVFLGGLFTAILYGILCLQVYIFFNRFTKERLLLKYSVITLWMMSSLHLAFMIHPLYIFLIKDFANPFALLEVPWTIAAGVIPTCLTDAIVRCWFTYRIWILSKKRVVLITLLAALIVADFVTGIWIAVKAFETSQTLDSFNKTAWLFYTNLSMGIFTDMFIAAALCYQLYQRKSGYTSRNTNTVLNLLMIYAVNTGLFTAIVNIGSIVTHAVMPSNYIFLAIYFTLGPLYVNALMGSLNARDWFRQQTTGKNHITIPLGSLHVSPAAKDEHSPDASSSAGGRSTDEYKPEDCIDIAGGARGDKVIPSV